MITCIRRLFAHVHVYPILLGFLLWHLIIQKQVSILMVILIHLSIIIKTILFI